MHSRHTRPLHLSDCLRASAQDLTREQPPRHREAAVLAAMRRALPRPVAPARPWLRPLAWTGAASFALLLLGVGLLLRLEPSVQPDDGSTATVASDFLPLVPPERWAHYLEQTRAEPAWLLSTELPRERLALLGLPYDPGRAGERVRAELLLAQPDGDLMAVRVLR